MDMVTDFTTTDGTRHVVALTSETLPGGGTYLTAACGCGWESPATAVVGDEPVRGITGLIEINSIPADATTSRALENLDAGLHYRVTADYRPHLLDLR